ncbi:36921_t:CDS:2, partial [Gigaspora margarita]
MATVITENISHVACIDESYKLIEETKRIIANLRKSKKIFDPILYSATETVRALQYVKRELESYFRHKDIFNKYKHSLEKIKEFAKEIEKLEGKFIYPYKQVKEKYEKLLKEHENCEKQVHPILIKIIMLKQESQQKDFMDIHKILDNVSNENKDEKIKEIKTIVQDLIEKSDLDINLPRIDPIYLSDPPHAVDSKTDNESDMKQDDCVQKKRVVKKVLRHIVEVACKPITHFEQNRAVVNKLKKFSDCRKIIKFYGISKINDDEILVFEWASLGSLKSFYEKKSINWELKVKIAHDICTGLLFLTHHDILHRDIRCKNIMMSYYMEPKIANFYYAKHVSEIEPDNKDRQISNHIMNTINWSAPEMMEMDAIYTQKCEVFSFVMLLWELTFQKIPYENKKSKEDIIVHVKQGRRESLSVITLDSIHIQRQFLKIIPEGWDNNPEKRITMDGILSKLSEIEEEITKQQKNNLDSVHSPNLLVPTLRTTRAISNPDKPNPDLMNNPDAFETEEPNNIELSKVVKPSHPRFSKLKSSDDNSRLIRSDGTIVKDRGFNNHSVKLNNAFKRRNMPVTTQSVPIPGKFKVSMSNQKIFNEFFEVIETICKEVDIPIVDIVTILKKCTQNKKLQSPESDPWWKIALILSYFKVASSHHKEQWEDKCNKAREYLTKQIGDSTVENELLGCTDKYINDNIAKKNQETTSPEKFTEIIKPGDDGSIEKDVPEDIITKIKNNITSKKHQLPELLSNITTAIYLSYLKNFSSQHECEWRDKYNKVREFISKRIGEAEVQKELKFEDEPLIKHCEITQSLPLDKVSDQVEKAVKHEL